MSELFERRFGRRADVHAWAPGRINIIGEHTDYNGGFVLPMALPLETHVYLARRPDSDVRTCSAEIAGGSIDTYTLGAERRGRGWLDYVQGVTAILGAGGARLSGVDLCLTSTVPVGKGLSSSAALQVGLVRALRIAFELRLDDVEVALTAHRAETEFVGAPVGIMDQMACSLGGQRDALFLNAGTAEFEHVPLPPSAGIGVVDSAIAHEHASGEYRVRHSECEAAAEALGVRELSALSVRDLPRIAALPAPLDRRARHVVTENARVQQAVDALRACDLERAGQLLNESHASMRDDFDITVPDIDCLVDIAQAQESVYGARMTGGGFGGAVVVLGRPETIAAATNEIASTYRSRTHRAGRALVSIAPWHIS